MRRVSEVYEQVLWGDQPLGWDIGGRKEVIGKLGRADFVDYINARYLPNNMVISLAGHFDGKETVALVKKYFGNMARQSVGGFVPVSENQKKPQLKVIYKKTDQAHLVVGVRSFKIGHPNRYIAAVLGTILGGGMSSRLFINVREKRGLAYYVRTDQQSSLDTGTFAASAGVDLKRIDEALKVILFEFGEITKSKIHAD